MVSPQCNKLSELPEKNEAIDEKDLVRMSSMMIIILESSASSLTHSLSHFQR